MVTDPARVRREDPGNPEVCPVFDLHKVFSTRRPCRPKRPKAAAPRASAASSARAGSPTAIVTTIAADPGAPPRSRSRDPASSNDVLANGKRPRHQTRAADARRSAESHGARMTMADETTARRCVTEPATEPAPRLDSESPRSDAAERPAGATSAPFALAAQTHPSRLHQSRASAPDSRKGKSARPRLRSLPSRSPLGSGLRRPDGSAARPDPQAEHRHLRHPHGAHHGAVS